MVRAGKKPAEITAPPGSFALVVLEQSPGCAHCTGLTRIEVRGENGPLGYLESTYPWDLEIPDDVAQHPSTPHYEMEWLALDERGGYLSDLTVKSLYFAGAALLDRALKTPKS